MKFFKKALVASAILGATSVAYAADLTDAKVDHSVQGLEVAAAAAESSIRVIVREQLEAGDQITLVFGAGVSGITAVAVDGSGDATTTTTDNELGLVYGSGTYKLRPVSVTTSTAGIVTVVVEVATGDPVTLDSSFEVQVRGANLVKAKASEASVTYSAKSGLTGDAKDTTGDNVGLLITTADQYSASVTTKLNAVIKRDETDVFTSGFTGADNNTDTLVVKVTDNQSLLTPASGVNVQATVTVAGDFSAATAYTATITNTGSGTANTLGALSIATDKKSASFTITDEATVAGIAGTYEVVFDTNADGNNPIKASEFTASVAVDADSTVTTNTVQAALTAADAGEWIIDATIINVPYLPVGKEGTSSSVHLSNETSGAVDVIVSAIDQNGTVYAPVDLGMDLAKQTVTKVSQTMLMDLFSIDAGDVTKLSVTFNIDASKGDVNAYAFTTDETGRTEISTSQQRGN